MSKFYWKYLDIDETLVDQVKDVYRKNLWQNNGVFFQFLDTGIKEFMGLELLSTVLIVVEPQGRGRIHTDGHSGYHQKLALNIPLENCQSSITYMYDSEYKPDERFIANGAPYKYYDPEKCKKVTEFTLTKPILFRSDIPHSVDNYSDDYRLAISLRFVKDPWHLCI